MGSVLALAAPSAPGEVGQGSAVRAGQQQLGGGGKAAVWKIWEGI